MSSLNYVTIYISRRWGFLNLRQKSTLENIHRNHYRSVSLSVNCYSHIDRFIDFPWERGMREGESLVHNTATYVYRRHFLTYQKRKGMVMSQCHHPAPPLVISFLSYFPFVFFHCQVGRSFPHTHFTHHLLAANQHLNVCLKARGGRATAKGSTSAFAECPGGLFVSHHSLRTLVFPRIHSVSHRASALLFLLVVDIIMSLSSRMLWRCRKMYPHYQVLVKWGRFFPCCVRHAVKC